MAIIPVKCKRRLGEFNLAKVIFSELGRNKLQLENGDILVVSSKFASMAEGRCLNLGSVTTNKEAEKLAKLYDLEPKLAKLVVDESENILGGIPGFALSIIKGTLAPNAGIDRSNVPHGYAILYPKNPDLTAERLRTDLIDLANRKTRAAEKKGGRKKTQPLRHLGVILSDSRVTPTRLGTIGLAISVSGLAPVEDLRGKKDLFGNELKYTIRAVADQFSSAAQIVMGEAADAIPVAIVRGSASALAIDESGHSHPTMTIDQDKCLIIQGLRNSYPGINGEQIES